MGTGEWRSLYVVNESALAGVWDEVGMQKIIL